MSAADALARARAAAKRPEFLWLWVFLPALCSFAYTLQVRGGHFASIGHVERLREGLDAVVPAGAEIAVLDADNAAAGCAAWVKHDDAPHVLYCDSGLKRVYKWEQGLGALTVGRSLFLDGRVARHLVANFRNGALVASDAAEPRLTVFFENGTTAALGLGAAAANYSVAPAPLGALALEPTGEHLLLALEGDATGKILRAAPEAVLGGLAAGELAATELVAEAGFAVRGLAAGEDFIVAASAASVHVFRDGSGAKIAEAGQFETSGFGAVAVDAKGYVWAAHGNGINVLDPNAGGAGEAPAGRDLAAHLLGRVVTGAPVTSVVVGGNGYAYATTEKQLLRVPHA
mmetsp:Transcript_32873/g.104068  ORF Transcript_32873/g.104068 Transcript_32873/m.104068 type:complete len:345 (-) Transcript_32873:256-1290(-)